MGWLKIILAAAVLVSLTGCWDHREVEDLAIITTMGLDLLNNGKIGLTVEIVLPQRKGGQQGGMLSQGSGKKSGGTYTMSSRGLTVSDAVAQLQPALPGHLFWGQLEVLVIGEKLARQGIRKQLDYLARESDIRLHVLPFICKGNAQDIMGRLSPLRDIQADVFREEVINIYKETTTLSMLLEDMGSEIEEAELPLMDVSPDKGNVHLAGNAVFKDDRMIGELNSELSIGLRWILNMFDHNIITLRLPDSEGYVSLSVLKSDTKLVPRISQGKWLMDIRIKAEEEVVQNASSLNISTPLLSERIARSAEELIRSQAKETLERVQKEWGTDILGFGEAFYRKYPQRHEQIKTHWDETFRSVEVTVSPKITIQRSGLVSSPSGLWKTEVK